MTVAAWLVNFLYPVEPVKTAEEIDFDNRMLKYYENQLSQEECDRLNAESWPD